MAKRPTDLAIIMTVGPLIDDTDFKSRETAVAYNAAGMSVSLFKRDAVGVTTVTAITLTTAGVNDWTHAGKAYYDVEITAAQNDTEGEAWLAGEVTGVLPFESPVYEMVPALLYNSDIAGTDARQVDVIQWEGAVASVESANWETSGNFPSAACTAASTTTSIVLDGFTAPDGRLKDYIVQIESGTAIFEAATITTNVYEGVGNTNTLTLDRTLGTAPDATSVARLFPAPAAAAIAILADTNELQTDWANGGRLDLLVDAIIARLPAALVGGRIDGSVGAMAADVVTAAALAADAVTEIAAGVGTRVPTEAGPTLGAAPSVEQLLVMIGAKLGVFRLVRSGTTMTAYRSDETTVIATWTLDSASAPTSVDRAS